MLRRIESFLAGRSRPWLAGLALTAIALVGVADLAAGPNMGFSTFYLIPIGIGTWLGGRRAGYGLAGVAALTGLFGDLVFPEARRSLYPYWNTSIRMALFVVVVELLAATKQRFEQERAVAEREREMSRRLEELDALKDTFLRAVSHDMRNPLAAVVGSASILQQRGEDLSKEQQTALIDAIVRSGRQITRLIEELLDVEKIRGRAFEPEAVVSQDLSSLVTGIVNEWAATRGRPVTFGDVDRVVVRVDPSLMQRILENLLDNAAKYSPPQGRIWVQVVRGAGGAILAVDDEGPGVRGRCGARSSSCSNGGKGQEPCRGWDSACTWWRASPRCWEAGRGWSPAPREDPRSACSFRRRTHSGRSTSTRWPRRPLGTDGATPRSAEGLPQIGDQVVGVLDPDRQADQRVGDLER